MSAHPPVVGAIAQHPILTIPVARMIPHPAQPPRHAPSQVTDLMNVIVETRVIDPIVVVPIGQLGTDADHDAAYYVVNGNRRVTVARLLGILELRAQVLPEVHTHDELMRLWSLFNGGAARITGKDIFWSWASIQTPVGRHKYLTHVMTWNRPLTNQIAELVAMVGEDQARKYALSGVGTSAKCHPNVVTRVKDVLKEAEHQGCTDYLTSAMKRKLVAWFYQHNMYREIGGAKRLMPSCGGQHPELLGLIMSAVMNNRPFSLNAHITFDASRPVGPTHRVHLMSDGTVQSIPLS